jgi:uncharacterized linocin/CFP29 family protein
MNNLHRELAPISDKAWAQIEEEASRTLKRHLAARRVVDVPAPKGLELALHKKYRPGALFVCKIGFFGLGKLAK